VHDYKVQFRVNSMDNWGVAHLVLWQCCIWQYFSHASMLTIMPYLIFKTFFIIHSSALWSWWFCVKGFSRKKHLMSPCTHSCPMLHSQWPSGYATITAMITSKTVTANNLTLNFDLNCIFFKTNKLMQRPLKYTHWMLLILVHNYNSRTVQHALA
jgi:hypothetical protein